MNGCEFCANQLAKHWIKLNGVSRLFCSEEHKIKFDNILKTLKFKAGWSTVDMLIAKKSSEVWICKAFRGMADMEFKVTFDSEYNIVTFQPIFEELI